MKIAVLQLHRIGDIVMSLPVLKALEDLHKGSQIYLVVRKKFSPKEIKKLPNIKIVELDTETILMQDTPRNSVEKIKEFVNSLPQFDLVVNLSACNTASLLAKNLKSKKYVGPRRSQEGVDILDDDYSFYIRAHIQGGDGTNRLHLTPLWLQMIGVESSKVKNYASLFKPTTKTTQDYVCIHLGASTVKKNLSVPDWVTVLKSLETKFKSTKIKVYGGQDELPLAGIVKKHFPNIECKINNTSLNDLFTDFQNAKGFLGVDSMASHVAALVGCPSLIIYKDIKFTNPFESLAFSPFTFGIQSDLASICHGFERLVNVQNLKDFNFGHIFGWPEDMSQVSYISSHTDEVGARFREIWMTIARGEALNKKLLSRFDKDLLQEVYGLSQFIKSIDITIKSITHLDGNHLAERLAEIRDVQRSLLNNYLILRHPCEELWLEESLLRGSIKEMRERYLALLESILLSCKSFEKLIYEYLADIYLFNEKEKECLEKQAPDLTAEKPVRN